MYNDPRDPEGICASVTLERQRKKREEFRRWIGKPGNREVWNKRRRDRRAAENKRPFLTPDQRKANYESNRLQRLYGLTLEQFQILMGKQGSRCALCGRVKRLCVDHDHATGKMRGLLCYACNIVVGMFERGPGSVEAISDYVARYK